MSTEARTVRPFGDFGYLTDVLETLTFEFGPDACLANQNIAIEIDANAFALRPAQIVWAEESGFDDFKYSVVKAVGAIEIPVDAVSLTVVASTSYLKDARVVASCSLRDINELKRVTRLTGPPRAPAFLAWQSGFTVDAFLLLNRPLRRAALQPWRKGTWLARASFAVYTQLGRQVFLPTPLTDEIRRRIGVPLKTMRYVELGDHDPLTALQDQGEEPVFYVDERILAELSAAPKSTASAALQVQLALDFISQTIHAASRQLADDPTKSAHDASLIGFIARFILGSQLTEETKAQIVDEIRTDPPRVLAKVEDSFDIGDQFIRSLKGADA